MLTERAQFHFFGSREVISLNLTLALLGFASSLVGVFIPLFLYDLGFPLWKILLFYFLRSAWYLVFSGVLLPVLRRISDKLMMFLAIPYLILYFIGLSRLDGTPLLFYLLPAADAAFMLLFWVGYHLDYSGSSDDGQVGREVGMRTLIGEVTAFASPFVGGVLIASLGFRNTFVIGSALLFLSVVPMFFFPRRKLHPGLNLPTLTRYMSDARTRPFRRSAFGYAAEKMVAWIVWPIFLYLAIGDIERFGALVSVGLLLGAVTTYIMGFYADTGRGKPAVRWTAAALSLVWLTRPFLPTATLLAGSYIVGKAVDNALSVPWSSLFYRVAHRLPHPGLFILATEIQFHFSRVLFFPLLILMAWLLPAGAFFTASFIIAAMLSLAYIISNRQSLQNLA